MTLPPTPSAKHVTLLIPHCLQMLKTTSTTVKVNAPPPLMEDHKDTLWIMQRADPFCKHISKQLLSGKAPSHEVDTFMHIKGLLYKHAMDSTQKFWH